MTARESESEEDSTSRSRLASLVRSAFASPEEADDRYYRIQALKGRVTVERHSFGARLSHWTQALLMFVLMGTGYAIWTGTYGPLNVAPWDGYYLAFGLHLWAGILLMAFLFVLFPLYHVYADGHRQLAELADVREAIHIGQAFVGLKSYIPGYHEARQTYDESERDWVAYHPMQKTFFWWISILFGVLVLTGFGMYAEMRADPVWWVEVLGFLDAWVGMVVLKQVHLLVFFLVVAMVFGHVYFAVLPSNWDVLRSMVFGEMDAYVLREDDDDEQ
ncbi:cytochrome b/b6 domain-containing protein [Halorussus halobius]|uniref:cytochrome b/b6 domain-containing protein n=1 Tax=Halorussus halobius TaxID=1710537 RepID=UPI00143D2229|nr:cytochrome b/b6 domain-containing protein [Halorussus halobius]